MDIIKGQSQPEGRAVPRELGVRVVAKGNDPDVILTIIYGSDNKTAVEVKLSALLRSIGTQLAIENQTRHHE